MGSYWFGFALGAMSTSLAAWFYLRARLDN